MHPEEMADPKYVEYLRRLVASQYAQTDEARRRSAEAEATGGWWTRQDEEQNNNPWLPPSRIKLPPVSSREPLWWEPGYDGPPVFSTEWAENEADALGASRYPGWALLGDYWEAEPHPDTGERVTPVAAANARLEAGDKRILASRGGDPRDVAELVDAGRRLKARRGIGGGDLVYKPEGISRSWRFAGKPDQTYSELSTLDPFAAVHEHEHEDQVWRRMRGRKWLDVGADFIDHPLDSLDDLLSYAVTPASTLSYPAWTAGYRHTVNGIADEQRYEAERELEAPERAAVERALRANANLAAAGGYGFLYDLSPDFADAVVRGMPYVNAPGHRRTVEVERDASWGGARRSGRVVNEPYPGPVGARDPAYPAGENPYVTVDGFVKLPPDWENLAKDSLTTYGGRVMYGGGYAAELARQAWQRRMEAAEPPPPPPPPPPPVPAQLPLRKAGGALARRLSPAGLALIYTFYGEPGVRKAAAHLAR
jgi:hypothetical protein